ncbi:NADH dehydrogenase [ubiquinone] 1 alpha subcomplex subunit 10, mitochondrial-like [Anneissia japonica]|uniref:NADH dehydrogenase [ubiquinone] 1 alpha subcomplex subunit 10, mitochondrial-like n=1 Tax=Anneissia japonica TaxID=1529436 RepID=UPI0014258636|nr:NADH dehydrogenase [ubiquinone] 1 alpha subcomplex subunit 10, mitochondrial-like [Anneissia japonica]
MATSAIRRLGFAMLRPGRQAGQGYIIAGKAKRAIISRPPMEPVFAVPVRGLRETVWTFFTGFKFDDTFHEGSKIFVVDGNIGSGKSELAKSLADKLGMKYMKEAHVHYLDEKLLGEGKKFDKKFMGNVSMEDFYKDPFAKDGHSFRLQLMMYGVRFMMYSDVLEHLFNTGQGIVMDRSVYSDFVFMEAMYKMGYFRKECYDFYNEIKGISLYRLRPPHLVIYLDTPVDVAKKRLKEREGNNYPEIPAEYLHALETAYKEQFLPMMAETSEVLTYDWSTYGDVEQIIEDIEFLTFSNSPWNNMVNSDLDRLYRFIADKSKVARCLDMEKYLPEVTFGGKQIYDIVREFREIPGNQFQKGYNESEYNQKNLWKLLFK